MYTLNKLTEVTLYKHFQNVVSIYLKGSCVSPWVLAWRCPFRNAGWKYLFGKSGSQQMPKIKKMGIYQERWGFSWAMSVSGRVSPSLYFDDFVQHLLVSCHMLIQHVHSIHSLKKMSSVRWTRIEAKEVSMERTSKHPKSWRMLKVDFYPMISSVKLFLFKKIPMNQMIFTHCFYWLGPFAMPQTPI